MVRSAAKNAAHVRGGGPGRLRAGGRRDRGDRRPRGRDPHRLMRKAFATPPPTDAPSPSTSRRARAPDAPAARLPGTIAGAWEKVQTSATARTRTSRGLLPAAQEPGERPWPSPPCSRKELSYNNLLDLQAALAAVMEHDATACVVIKHNTPSAWPSPPPRRRPSPWPGLRPRLRLRRHRRPQPDRGRRGGEELAGSSSSASSRRLRRRGAGDPGAKKNLRLLEPRASATRGRAGPAPRRTPGSCAPSPAASW